jgi:hypothetical protein
MLYSDSKVITKGENSMLEIVAILILTNHVGKIVEAKGLKSGGYKWGAAGL